MSVIPKREALGLELETNLEEELVGHGSRSVKQRLYQL